MSETKTNNGNGIGFVGLLTIVFITLKLCGVIDWSWWWVLSPIWITMLITLTIFLIVLIIYSVVEKRKINQINKQVAAKIRREDEENIG